MEYDSGIGFFDKLGERESARRKKRAELAKDYEEFKKRDEEKFKNRFANKKQPGDIFKEKATKTTTSSDGSFLEPKREVTAVNYYSDEHSNINSSNGDVIFQKEGKRIFNESEKLKEPIVSLKSFEERIAQLAQKIDLLYEDKQNQNRKSFSDKSVNDKYHSELRMESSSNGKLTLNDEGLIAPEQMKLYERELQARLRMIKDAEERLVAIENEYTETKLNNSPGKWSMPTRSQKSHSSEHLIENPIPINHQMFSERENSPQSKHRKQQLYREELEKQILEARQKKMDEKLKEENYGNLKNLDSRRSSSFRQNSLPREIITNHISNYSQSTNGDPDYFNFGQSELVSNMSTTKFDLQDNISNHSKLSKNGVENNAGTNESLQSKKIQYAQELRQQIEEARKKKELQKKKDEELDRKIEAECATYDPFDASITKSHTKQIPVSSSQSTKKEADAPSNNTENKFARGGHGIFGSPLTAEQKTNLNRYKEDLAQQIAEKKRAAELQRQKEMELEIKENERLAAEQLRMQKEFEEERARLKAKQEEEKRFAEEQRKAGELRKKEKMEQNEKLKAKSTNEEPIRYAKPEETASNSKKRHKKQPKRLKSPELLIGPEQNATKYFDNQITKTFEPESSPIIKQLKSLRTQLDIERKKVEDALIKSRNDKDLDGPLTFDGIKSHPRVVKKGSHLFSQNEAEGDRFLQHSKFSATKRWAQEMAKEENHACIEKQQAAYLKAQEAYLAKLKEDLSHFSLNEMQNDTRLHEIFKSDEDKRMKETSRSSSIDLRLDQPPELTPRSISLSSVNIEEIAAKNEQRLKRLEAMQLLNDIDADPEAVLQRFIEKHDGAHSTKQQFSCY